MGNSASKGRPFYIDVSSYVAKAVMLLTGDRLSEVWLESLVGIVWLFREWLIVLWASKPGRHVGTGKVELRSGSRFEARQILLGEDERVLDILIGDI